jgi:hypothetical protein
VTRFWPDGGDQVAALPDGAVVLAEEETHIILLPWVRATWAPPGSASRS